MRRFAEQATAASNVRYVDGRRVRPVFPALSADIVTAAQSLQWMRPEDALPEAARSPRDGGVFCAYNYVVLQTPTWEAGASFSEATTSRQRASRAVSAAAATRMDRQAQRGSRRAACFGTPANCFCTAPRREIGERLVGFALRQNVGGIGGRGQRRRRWPRSAPRSRRRHAATGALVDRLPGLGRPQVTAASSRRGEARLRHTPQFRNDA